MCSLQVSVLHGTSMSLPVPSWYFYSHSHPGPTQTRAVFTVWVPVPVIPICSGILPIMECHDVESGAVSRPIAETCDVTAAIPRVCFIPGPTELPAPGSPAGQKVAVSPEFHGTPVRLLLLPLPCKTL